MSQESRAALYQWPNAEQRVAERQLKREAVLQAAVKLFNRKGFHDTSLDEVASTLNVTKPTIYHYFPNKGEILFECVRRGLEAISEAVGHAQREGGNGLARLKSLMERYALVMTQEFGMCVTRTADHELSKESGAEFRRLKKQIDRTVRKVIEAGMNDGSIVPGDSRMVAFTITGALNWIARWYRPEGADSAEQVAANCVAVLIAGLSPKPGS